MSFQRRSQNKWATPLTSLEESDALCQTPAPRPKNNLIRGIHDIQADLSER